MSQEYKKPAVTESYGTYVPRGNIIAIVDGLMDYVPGNFYVGLQEICLTDSSTLSQSKMRSKTTEQIRIGQVKALYWPASTSAPARIEIFLDKVLNQLPTLLGKMMFFKEIVIAEVLFHELGHHLQSQQKYRTRRNHHETFAEECAVKLLQNLLNKKYKLLKPFVSALNISLDIRDRVASSRQK